MTKRDCIRNQPWAIRCRVIKTRGVCGAGHKVGDEALFIGEEVKGRLCMTAMYSMLPKVVAIMYNARHPWLKDQCVSTHACPDRTNPVTFELLREEPS